MPDTMTLLRNAFLASATFAIWIGAHAAEPASPTSSISPSQAAQTEQVVVPEITRRDIKRPRMPSKDFEMGLFGGTYATQNFGSSFVKGLRLGYHLSEDFFVEGVYGQTKVSDELYRQVLPGGVFQSGKNKLEYYNISAGYNVLPGEVFLGANRAMPFALYLIGGVGTTLLADQRMATFNFGSGMRVFYNDNVSLQLDVRDHIFTIDLLGKQQRTQNLEYTLGLTVSF